MKFVTFEVEPRDERLGVLLDEQILDLTTAVPRPEFSSLLALIEAGEDAWADARRRVEEARPEQLRPLESVRLRAPIPLPPQIRDSMAFHKHIRQASFAIARRAARANGSERALAAAEAYVENYRLPAIHRRQPVYYKANRFSVADPGEDIPWPDYSEVMDFELELAVVIGKGGRDISRERALEHVFGLMIFNDFSARDAQAAEMEGSLGPAKGKDFDKANSFGPCLVTLDEIGDPHALSMVARVNGEVWCDSSSSTMDWRFEDLIAHISRGETLRPGEIIGSGTVGDGCGLEHERFLNDGDVVELEVEKIGTLRNRVVRPG